MLKNPTSKYKDLTKKFLLTAVSVCTISISSAVASELKVLDCAGNIRASTEMLDGESKQLRFKLAANESHSSGKLSKLNANSTLESHATDRSLKFESVQAGEWKLCKTGGEELAFDSVEFVDGLSENLRVASLIAGSAAVASGIAIAADDSSSDDQSAASVLEISEGPDRSVNEVEVNNTSAARPQNEIIADSRCDKLGKKPATAAAKASNNGCREGEKAPVISPYE